MPKLTVFNSISLDGYFTDARGQMDWAKADSDDAEFARFTSENAGGDSVLVFGRITYDLMASFWPTPAAAQMMPAVARKMNEASKLVFSRGLEKAAWSNTRIVASDPAAEIRRLKAENGAPLTVLGSGTIVAQLTEAHLADEYHFIVNPIVLGAGRTLFEGVTHPPELKLARTRAFQNGKVFLTYTAS